MSEPTQDSADRQRWTPRLAHARQSPVAAIDARAEGEPAGMAVAAELFEIAQRGLDDHGAAERIVAWVIDEHPTLVKYAASGQSPAERDAARAQLASFVRRATLDAMPPVVASPVAPQETVARPAAVPDRPAARPMRRRAATVGFAPDLAEARPGRRRLALVVAICLLLLAGGLGTLFLMADPFASTADDASGPSEATESPDDAAAAPPPPQQAAEVGAQNDAISDLRIVATEPEAGDLEEPAVEPPIAASLPPVAPTTRVFVHYADAADDSNAQADTLYAALSRDGGYPLVVLRGVNYTIATPRVRFFHADDAAAADRLAVFLARAAGIDAWQVQDFTSFRPQPAPGTLEIYVPPS